MMARRPFQAANYSLTHTGLARKLNEDRYFASPKSGVWVIADGMGGHDAGDLASEEIVRSFQGMPEFHSAQALGEYVIGCLRAANNGIRAISQARGGAVMGSTVVALLTFEGAYRCVWAGDSRGYLLRGDTLIQLSRDHTEVQELLDSGTLTPEEAANYGRKNVITRAVGVDENLLLDAVDGTIAAGDTFLLCSDGLTSHVSNLEIGELMAGRRSREICEMLIDLALKRGGSDNVTVSVIQFQASNATIPVSNDYHMDTVDPK